MSDCKDVIIGAEAKAQLKEGVDQLAGAVKVTLGPRGRNAAIERPYGPPLITKDGVTVARSINLKGRVQNMGAQLIKSVAASANAVAGDGTTTATVLAQAIFNRGFSAISAGHNPVLVKRGIDIAVTKLVDRLAEISVPIDNEESIKSVATISANNDSELGEMIAEAVSAVGEYGFITVEAGTRRNTEVIYLEGLKIARGLLSTDFVSNPSTLTCELQDAYVLCYDDKVEAIIDMGEILTEVANTGKPLLIIAKDYTKDALNHILLNRIKENGLDWCAIKAPGFGDTRREMLKDICVMTGGKLLTNDHGQKFKGVTLKDLGKVGSATIGLNETTLVGGAGGMEAVEERIEMLKGQIANLNLHPHQVENISERISRLSGGAALFRVGGASESEVREKKDRVEDAINAVKSALVEGVVPGGGAALLHSLSALNDIDEKELLPEEIVGIKIVKDAVKEPIKQILANAGDSDEYYKIITRLETSGTRSGYDALRRIFVEDMIGHGVMDPTKVVRTSLEQAASATGTLLTTEVVISDMLSE